MPYSYTELDSSISLAMIMEGLKNQSIKQVLAESAAYVRTTIFTRLSAYQKQTGSLQQFKNLAIQHSSVDKMIGALLPDYPAEYLLNEGQLLLLDAIDNCLQSAGKINELNQFLQLMKCFEGMARVYDDLETKANNSEHLYCKGCIMPTAAENAIRASRPEDLLATSYGIGNEKKVDLDTKQNAPFGAYSGKARFFILPPENRALTWFEKLANQSHLEKPSLPLVASASNSTARIFIMANGINLFQKENGLFDLDKAQIFANCVMAYLVYCGHHSFFEVAEIWNRQLDFVAIEHPEQLPENIIPSTPSMKPYMHEPEIIERKLPYAEAGSYSRFLHPSYAKSVIQNMYEQVENGLKLQFKP